MLEFALGILLIPFLATIPAACRFLFEKPTIIAALSIALLSLAAFGYWQFLREEVDAKVLIYFVTPIVQFSFAAISYHLFRRLMRRAPKEVALNWSSGLLWDRVYAIGVFLIPILVPMNLI